MKKLLLASAIAAFATVTVAGGTMIWQVASVHGQQVIQPASAQQAPKKSPIIQVDGGGGM